MFRQNLYVCIILVVSDVCFSRSSTKGLSHCCNRCTRLHEHRRCVSVMRPCRVIYKEASHVYVIYLWTHLGVRMQRYKGTFVRRFVYEFVRASVVSQVLYVCILVTVDAWDGLPFLADSGNRGHSSRYYVHQLYCLLLQDTQVFFLLLSACGNCHMDAWCSNTN